MYYRYNSIATNLVFLIFLRCSWVPTSSIKGYAVPYAAQFAGKYACPRQSPYSFPADYTWVPAPPCNFADWQ